MNPAKLGDVCVDGIETIDFYYFVAWVSKSGVGTILIDMNEETMNYYTWSRFYSHGFLGYL